MVELIVVLIVVVGIISIDIRLKRLVRSNENIERHLLALRAYAEERSRRDREDAVL
jgi:hypothetical protein